jgi:hypothetical protein
MRSVSSRHSCSLAHRGQRAPAGPVREVGQGGARADDEVGRAAQQQLGVDPGEQAQVTAHDVDQAQPGDCLADKAFFAGRGRPCPHFHIDGASAQGGGHASRPRRRVRPPCGRPAPRRGPARPAMSPSFRSMRLRSAWVRASKVITGTPRACRRSPARLRGPSNTMLGRRVTMRSICASPGRRPWAAPAPNRARWNGGRCPRAARQRPQRAHGLGQRGRKRDDARHRLRPAPSRNPRAAPGLPALSLQAAGAGQNAKRQAWRPSYLVFDPALGRHPGVEGVLDLHHLGDGVGQLDDLGRAAAARDAHVHMRRPLAQRLQHAVQRQPAVDQRDRSARPAPPGTARRPGWRRARFSQPSRASCAERSRSWLFQEKPSPRPSIGMPSCSNIRCSPKRALGTFMNW